MKKEQRPFIHLAKAAFGLATALFLLSPTLGLGQALPPVEYAPDGAAFRRGEVLIQFKDNVTDEQLTGAFQRGRLAMIKHIRTPAMEARGRIGLTRTATSLPVLEAVRLLRRLPGVEFAEPDYVATQDFESNDPLYLDGSLWGLFGDDQPELIGPVVTTNPFGSQAEKAWAAGFIGSPDVYVGVVDGGLQLDHPDLAPNIWVNPGEIPGNGIDDDGNGYVDDVHGWNASNDDGNVWHVDDATDFHGSHVAGIVGAAGGNGLGVTGVNWNVSLISGKMFPGGYYSDAIQTIDYMTHLKTRKGLNIVAINHSWGGASFSQALLDAITRAAQAGILTIAGAGNHIGDVDVSPVYPAAFNTTASAGYDAVIAVAGINNDGNRRATSNYGATSVDLAAPGGEIWSTVPTDSYRSLSGTSMAAPHVSGAVALYASANPGANALQIRQDILTAGVQPLTTLQGITVTGGTLDIGTLMGLELIGLETPAAPASLQASAVSGARVDLSWSDRSNNELGFAIERSTDGATYYLADTVGAGYQGYSDRSVQPGNTYYYRVFAFNAGGGSEYANTVSVTTPTVTLPNAPSSLKASALSFGRVSLSWKDNANNEDGFQIERRTGSTGTWQLIATVGANTKSYTDTSTARRTTYNYRVRAINAAGGSAYSNLASVKTR